MNALLNFHKKLEIFELIAQLVVFFIKSNLFPVYPPERLLGVSDSVHDVSTPIIELLLAPLSQLVQQVLGVLTEFGEP